MLAVVQVRRIFRSFVAPIYVLRPRLRRHLYALAIFFDFLVFRFRHLPVNEVWRCSFGSRVRARCCFALTHVLYVTLQQLHGHVRRGHRRLIWTFFRTSFVTFFTR